MPRLDRVKELNRKLKDLQRKAKNVKVVVGYAGVNYAVFVHENLEAFHHVGKAKFLEDPARNKASDIANVIRDRFRQTGNMRQSLIVGGLLLQRESQKEVPIDTGNLRASAFTKAEDI